MNTIVEFLAKNAKDFPDRVAVAFENTDITYKELWARAKTAANMLKNMGVCEGDRVICQAQYGKGYVIALFATHLVHGVFVPIEKKVNADAVGETVYATDAKLVISEIVLYAGKTVLFEEIEECKIDDIPDENIEFPTENMLSDIMFTTGTTGKPKGVMLSHRSIMNVSKARLEVVEVKEGNVAITYVPINHVAPMRELYMAIFRAGTIIFIDGIARLKAFSNCIEKYHATSIYVPPAGISMFMRFSANLLPKYKDQIDYVYTASAPMSEEHKEYMRNALPNSRLFFSYGSSENGTVCLLQYSKDVKASSCVGFECPGATIRIVDDNDNEVKTNETGIITIKSNMNMDGYWKRPELTEESFKDDYFVSSDLGFRDENGFIYIVGRYDDIINVGGLKVFPTEIEDAAMTVDGVEDCVCVSESDEITGSSVKLIVKKMADREITNRDIFDILRDKLDTYKLPKKIEFADKIERTANGKLNRKAYR